MKKLLLLVFVFLFGSQITIAQTAVDLSTITSNNNISTNYDLDLANGFTLEGWFKFNQLGIYQGIFGKTNVNVPHPLDTYLVDSTNEITVFLGNGGSFQNFNTGLIISDNNWHHIAFTYNVTTKAINSYLDGVAGASFTYTGSALSNTTNPLLIGNRADGVTNASALVDDVRLWSTPRSAADIALAATNNTCFTGAETNLEVYYTMTEGSGTTLTDLALGNGAQNGTISNGGWATEGITPNTSTPAPTGLATQVYTGDNKTLANVTVTGTTIKWYDAAANGNLLPNTTALVDETIYYASNTTSCGESTTRLAVTVNRISDNTQTFTSCPTTVANLASTPSTGTAAQWFTTSSNGTAMLSTDVLTTGTYYVEQSIPESIETLGSGFSNPRGVTVQSDGKILIADFGNNAIKRMDADGTNIETLGSGFSSPYGVTVQSDGKIIIADTGNSAIKRMDADGTNIVTLGSGFSSPNGVAVQADGKILIADFGNSAIKRMDANGTNIVTLGSGFSNPIGVTVQSDGKILIADYGNNAIKRFTAAGTSNRVAVDVTILLPEIDVKGLGNSISDGSTAVQFIDDTHFGDVYTNDVHTFTIDNTAGTNTLNITSIVSSGTNASDFILGNIPTAVTAGNTDTFTVTFTPGTAGEKTATIIITNNDCNETVYDFRVRGIKPPLNGDLNITDSCSDVSVLGAYNENGTVNGKPQYLKVIQSGAGNNGAEPACNDYTTSTTCATSGSIIAIIRWNGSAWEWVKEATPMNCQWFAVAGQCIPGFRLAATTITAKLATEILATSSENTPYPPCTNWVAGAGGCIPNFDCSALSTNDIELLNQLSTIFPNPNNGNFTLSYSGQEQLKKLSIFDVTGKIIKTISLNNFNQSQEISLTALAQGMYFINIESETASTTKRLIIK